MNVTRLVWEYQGERTGIFRGMDDFTSSYFAEEFTELATEKLPVPNDTAILPILLDNPRSRWFFTDTGMLAIGYQLIDYLRNHDSNWFDHNEPDFPLIATVNINIDPSNILYEDSLQVLVKGDVYNEGLYQP